jgi:hypothetical protein
VHYPWHPWHGRSVFIDERLEKNSLVVFRCHVEETQQWIALEIPDSMFDVGCSRMFLADKPVGGEFLKWADWSRFCRIQLRITRMLM